MVNKIPPSLFMLVTMKQMLPSILFTFVEYAAFLICCGLTDPRLGLAVNIPTEILSSAGLGSCFGMIGMMTDLSIAIFKWAIANRYLNFCGSQLGDKNLKSEIMIVSNIIFGVASINFLLLVPYAIFVQDGLVALVTNEYWNRMVFKLWNVARVFICFISKSMSIKAGWEMLYNKSGLEGDVLPM